MGYSKDQLLVLLKDLKIDFLQYEHPVVLTVEAQAKYVGHMEGGLSKNLFLKDKKHRLYIVSALTDTKVDLKVLSQRLGLGKGGLRMAPEETLRETLQVPLGCVTPFALVNKSAGDVSLLLDRGFKSHDRCFFHPLSNDISISLNSRDLDLFLKSVGREPSYVDFEANLVVGKDQPPDLATLVPSGASVLMDLCEKTVLLQDRTDNHTILDNKPTAITVKSVKPQNVKSKPANSVTSLNDPANFVQEFLDKTVDVIVAEITEENVKQREQLGSVISDCFRNRLTLELEILATMFKNAAYTEGFHAGVHHKPKRT